MAFFTFLAKTIDGQIYECPVALNVECGKLTPVGLQVIRQFDPDYCIVATEVFLVDYGGKSLGSNEFKTIDGYLQYMNDNCCSDKLVIDGCGVN